MPDFTSEEHKATIVVVDNRYHVHSKNQVSGKPGLAHLIERLLADDRAIQDIDGSAVGE